MPTNPTVPRLTERLLVSAFTIKSDLDKAIEIWQENFRDPIKAALLAGPQADAPAVTELTLGGIRAALTKTFPKDAFDVQALAVTLAAGLRTSALTAHDVSLLLDAGVLTIADPRAALAVICPRMQHVQAVDYVIRAVNPEVPTVVALKMSLVPNQATTPVGVLHDVPERVSVAAAASSGRIVATPAGAPTSTMAAAIAIDAANAAGHAGSPLVTEIEDPAGPAPTEVAVNRPARRRRRSAR